jgi:cyclic beta-1,2-glucan synthetase
MSGESRFVSVASHDAHVLSNGRYTVVVTPAGSGFSRWGNLALTRWRGDPTSETGGSYLLLADRRGGPAFSPSFLPFACDADACTTSFSDGCAEFVRRDESMTAALEVAVATDRDAELGRLTLTNEGRSGRDLVLTSYSELVLGDAAADAAHPAFSKLFVQTEALGDDPMLIATRRRRDPHEPEIWAAHFSIADGRNSQDGTFETDRGRFLGRGRGLRNAQAMHCNAPLSNTSGTVLDPIFSLRRCVHLPRGESARITFVTAAAESRQRVLDVCESLREAEPVDDILFRARQHAARERARFGLDTTSGLSWIGLLAPLLVPDRAWRAAPDQLGRGAGGPPALWGLGISGDRPIVVLHVSAVSQLDRAQELTRVQLYFRSQGIDVDVVMLNCAGGRAGDDLQTRLDHILGLQQAQLRQNDSSTRAQIFLLKQDALPMQVRDGLAAAARVSLDASDERTLAKPRQAPVIATIPVVVSTSRARHDHTEPDAWRQTPLDFDNGLGGFDVSRREYAITLRDGACTPVPWINVVANPDFGFLVSAEGGGYTWSINSQQNPLTPWPNDPVTDATHEVLYLRDEDSGELWSATAQPCRVSAAVYTVRHGKGYSRFAHVAHDIEHDLVQCVPVDDSIKLSRLRLTNRSERPRRLSLTAYVEWALGANGTTPAPFVITALDVATGALFARNRWRAEFADRVVFADLGGAQESFTADRMEFLGRHGTIERPAALLHAKPLSGRFGAGLDPCAAMQVRLGLEPGATIDVVFLLGDAESDVEARKLIERYRGIDIDRVLRDVRVMWSDVLETVQVRTPDRAMDLMLNDWLLYQTLACRLWARTAYYQASGAYGFRDQLQDVMALCVARPDLAREHLLRAAGRQFTQGDVQHWWLPPSGQGLRTRMVDDRVWLVYVAMHYVDTTADAAVFDQIVPFIEGDLLKDGQNEAYFLPKPASERASLYEHCARAIDASLSLGYHELPLIGTGDWNDGMNRVGEQGRGESIWMGWFLLDVIGRFARHADARSDSTRAARWRDFGDKVRAALENAGWDGAWYRRGYYDDGTPLGSSASGECRIDAIAQSWSVISKCADPQHASIAMDSLYRELVRQDERIAPLLTPPFDRTRHDPGYIKAYPPGIRENGGQYTHGAIWSIFAFAALGQANRAKTIFDIVNPIRHAMTASQVERYKVEPYVACADVYSVEPHVGRGGWTWYTGSAGWLYRAGLEAILGFRVQGNTLTIDPCVPSTWDGFEIVFQRRDRPDAVTRYEIEVGNPRGVNRGVKRIELDGVEFARGSAAMPLVRDGSRHSIRVELG